MTVGQRIKKARIDAGLTQAQLAKKLNNIPFQGVSQWEREVRKPKFETLEEIAKAVDVPVEFLLYGTTKEELAFEKLESELPGYGYSISYDDNEPGWCYIYPTDLAEDPTFIMSVEAKHLPIFFVESELKSAISDGEKLKSQFIEKRIKKSIETANEIQLGQLWELGDI